MLLPLSPSCPELLVSFGISSYECSRAVLHVEATGISVYGQHPELMGQILLDLSLGDPAVTVRPASEEQHGVTSAEKFLVRRCTALAVSALLDPGWSKADRSGRFDRASSWRLRWCISIR